MVRLPKPLADKVRGFAASIPDELLFSGIENMPSGRAEDIHVTVKYGLMTWDADEVNEAVRDVEPFNITLGRCGVFYNEKNIVLKISADSRELVAFHQRVCRRLRHVNLYPEYKPHVTVAYLVKNDADPYYYKNLYDESLYGEKFGVDQVVFTTKGGNEYVLPLNGTRSVVARRMVSSERIAKWIETANVMRGKTNRRMSYAI